MEAANRALSEKFSSGDFAAVYIYFSDTIEWNIVGNQILKGKAETIAFCNKMRIEMESSKLENSNSIEHQIRLLLKENVVILMQKVKKLLYNIVIFTDSKTIK